MIEIDGSQGEGGGQIVRSAISLSIVTGQPVHIVNIRAGRSKPGLMRQHMTSVLSAARICGAEVDGAQVGSRELWFTPGRVQGGVYTFSIGSAGSTTLVLQTVLPPLLTADVPSQITVEGGTHNPHAPPVEFLQRAFLPLVNRLGVRVELRLERYGFYPRGGGRIVATIEPVKKLSPFCLNERGEIYRTTAEAVVVGLPPEIGERELTVVNRRLGWKRESQHLSHFPRDYGPGNFLTLEVASQHVTEIFTGFGQRGVRAETVAEQAVEEAERYLAVGAPVGEHLADQLLLPLALAGGGAYTTGPLSLHSITNIQIIEMFLPVRVHTRESGAGQWRVEVVGQ